MVDIQRLKGKIIEKGFTVLTLSDQIGIDRTTLYRRFSDHGKSFTIGEIEQIVSVLHLTEQEAREIFFVQEVA